MTSYSYTIHIDDGEKMALEAALKQRIAICETEIEGGNKVPFFAQREYCRRILEMLKSADKTLMSTSSYTAE